MARFYKLLEHAYKKSETLKTILAFVLLPHIFTNGLNKIHFLNSFRNHFAQVSGKEAVNVLWQWAGGLWTAGLPEVMAPIGSGTLALNMELPPGDTSLSSGTGEIV